MPRPPRRDQPGDVHHVFARRADHVPMFVDAVDRLGYLKLLRREVNDRRWRCLAFCLMDTHVHFLVEAPEAGLSTGMQRLQGDYVLAFNHRHGRDGGLWASRFNSVLVEDDEQLWTVARYIALNPVKAGMCARPEQHPWSSHACVTYHPELDWLHTWRLFELFGGRGRYLAFVDDGLDALR